MKRNAEEHKKKLGRREAGATHGANHQQTGCVKARQEGTFKIKQEKHKFKTQTEAGGEAGGDAGGGRGGGGGGVGGKLIQSF